jgi:hypothetical protein
VDTPTEPELVIGQRYRLVYRSQTQRLPREAVMTYLGRDGDTLSFDARPVAGTQHMPAAWLRTAEPVPRATKAVLNRVLREAGPAAT